LLQPSWLPDWVGLLLFSPMLLAASAAEHCALQEQSCSAAVAEHSVLQEQGCAAAAAAAAAAEQHLLLTCLPVYRWACQLCYRLQWCTQ
jgi:hypothetical protein